LARVSGDFIIGSVPASVINFFLGLNSEKESRPAA
jgi:hypothetical protein